MNGKSFSLLVVLLALPSSICQAAPAYNGYNNGYNNSNYNSYPANYNNSNNSYSARPIEVRPLEDNTANARQARALNDLKNEVNNHEAEIRTFESRLNNQETILENVRQQLTETVQAQQELSKAQSVNLEGRIDSLDGTVKGLIADMRLIKTQSNDTVAILAQYKQKLGEFEKLIEAQNQHMKNLEAALNSIMEVLQAKEASEKAMSRSYDTPIGSKTYKVQPGDSLEKVARMHKVSVQALRDANKLNQDRIMVGQTLKIP